MSSPDLPLIVEISLRTLGVCFSALVAADRAALTGYVEGVLAS